jgi:hypothetical protein
MNTALEYSTRVVQEGGRRCKKSTLNDLVHLTPLRIPLLNPPTEDRQHHHNSRNLVYVIHRLINYTDIKAFVGISYKFACRKIFRNYAICHPSKRKCIHLQTESIATLPPFGHLGDKKWFFQISSQWESARHRYCCKKSMMVKDHYQLFMCDVGYVYNKSMMLSQPNPNWKWKCFHFSWGYICSQILGGRMAELYGFKLVYGLGKPDKM